MNNPTELPITVMIKLIMMRSGVGAQSAAPGLSRKFRPLLRAVMLYL